MKKFILSFVFVLLAFSIVNCGSSSSGTDASMVPSSTITLYGRVIDRTTRAAITDAAIEVLVGNDVYVGDYNRDDADTTLFTESDYFTVNVPIADQYDIRIGKTGYATYRNLMTLAGISAGSSTIAANQNLGDITLGDGFDLSVYVVDKDTAAVIAGATVYAVAESWTDTDAALGLVSTYEISAVTDATGLATLSGLSSLSDYRVIAPALDTDDDGVYEYVTSTQIMGGAQTLVPTTATIAMDRAGVSVVPTMVTYNSKQYSGSEVGAFAAQGMPVSGSLVYVFAYPITSADVTMALNSEDDFVPDNVFNNTGVNRDLDFNFDGDMTDTGLDVPVTATLSAGNVMLTVTPTSALSNLGIYTFDAVISYVRPEGDTTGNTVSDSIYGLGGSVPADHYVFAFADADTSIAAPTIDNYNGSDDASGGTDDVYLEFSEPVYGTAIVLASTAANVTEYVNDTTATEINLSTGTLLVEGDEVVFGVGDQGCASDTGVAGDCADSNVIKYVVNTTFNLNDNTTTDINNLTIIVHAMDYVGNTLDEEYTLSVQ